MLFLPYLGFFFFLAETKILILTYFEPYHISLGTYVLWKVSDVLKNGANGLGSCQMLLGRCQMFFGSQIVPPLLPL